jgi:transcriptional regulator with XRE-family HTH domain
MENKKIIGEKIHTIRTSEKLTNQKFAEKFSINESTVRSIENGINYPSIQLLLNIAAEYNLSLDWLTGRTDVREVSKNCSKHG